MDLDSFLKEISEKYGYDENLQTAIRLTIPLMLERYQGREEDVFRLFREVPILATSDMSKENRKRIEKEMTSGTNEHIEDQEDANPYGSTNDPGAYYSYETIFDEKMDVVGERRWLVVCDIDDKRKDAYQQLFGTTINMPYFIHEINHAFAMQHPTYHKEGNTIYSKHGMYEWVQDYSQSENGKFKLSIVSSEDIIVEEMLNENITQDMLVKLLGVTTRQEVDEKLKEIGHVPTNYRSTLLVLGTRLEEALGRDDLDKWRIDNDLSVRERFSTISNASRVAKTFFPEEDAYQHLGNGAYEVFTLFRKCYTMDITDFGQQLLKTSCEAMAPIFGYQEQMGTKTFDDYVALRKRAIGEEETKDVEASK